MGTAVGDELGTTIAGYRLIRRLGGGSHSDLYLGHADIPAGHADAAVVVKVFRPGTDHDLITTQLAALTAGPAGGLPQLIDLATLPDDRVVLVLERIDGPALSAVLDRRPRIAPGEAVTILAPVIVALAHLHNAGFAHETLGQATVRFQLDGRPRLTGLGGLRRLPGFPVPGRHEAAPALPAAEHRAGLPRRFDLVRADYTRLARLAHDVVDHLPATDAPARRVEALLAWFEMTATAVPFQSSLEELERRLFAWAPASPVRLAEPVTPPLVPARIEPPDPAPAASGDEQGSAQAPGLLRRLEGVLDHDPVQQMRRFTHDWLARQRGPLIVLVCLAAAATVLGLTLMPSTATERAPTTEGAIPSRAEVAAAPRTAAPTSPAAPRTATSPSPAEKAPPVGAINGPDPVRAAAALLAGRHGCLAAASVDCLAAFDQTGSVVMEADRYAIEHQGVMSVPALGPQDVGELRERTGDFAIVALTRKTAESKGGDSEPASLLLVKGEAGWRLRQILD